MAWSQGRSKKVAVMATQDHLDVSDPKYRKAAARILWLYDRPSSESDVRTAVRDFLIATGLANADEISGRISPGTGLAEIC